MTRNGYTSIDFCLLLASVKYNFGTKFCCFFSCPANDETTSGGTLLKGDELEASRCTFGLRSGQEKNSQ